MTANEVKLRLLESGYSVAKWARKNGHHPATTLCVVKRWAGKKGIPKGEKTYRILNDLRKTLGQPIYSLELVENDELT